MMMDNLYKKDFYAWTMQNALLMKEGKMDELDIENLIEEIESMGRSEKWELIDRLSVLISHLLKWQYQTSLRGRSWELTIKEQRRRIDYHLKENSSLKGKMDELLKESYQLALLKAEKETGLNGSIFPQQCSYDFKEIMDDEFYPNQESKKQK